MRRFTRRRYYQRQYSKRFLRPIDRLALSPDGVARTVFVGLFWGLSGLLGAQLVGVTLTWLAAKWLDRPFSLPVAILLTGVTNPVTITPLFTLYYVTGCGILPGCRFGDHSVTALVAQVHEVGPWRTLVDAGEIVSVALLGSLPFALAGGIAGYYLGRFVGLRLQHRRRHRPAILADRAPHLS